MLRFTNCTECGKEIDKDKDSFYLTFEVGKYLCKKCGENHNKKALD